MKERLAGAAERVASTRFMRAFGRFTQNRGPLLAAGIAYMGLFSLTAGLTVGWTTFSGILTRRPLFKASVIEAVNTQIPGLLRSPETPNGIVDPDTLVSTPGTATAGWIALGIAIVTASTVIWYLGLALRSMFGLADVKERLLPAYLGRIIGLFVLIAGVVAIGVLMTAATFLHTWVRETFGHGAATGFEIGTLLIPFAIDMIVFIAMVRLVARVRPLRRDLFMGALLAAIASTLLRTLGTSVITGVRGPVLATAASLVTIMLWLNFLGWITLYVAAWTANPPPPSTPRLATDAHQLARPNYVTLSAPATLTWVSADTSLLQEHDLKTADPTSGPGRSNNRGSENPTQE